MGEFGAVKGCIAPPELIWKGWHGVVPGLLKMRVSNFPRDQGTRFRLQQTPLHPPQQLSRTQILLVIHRIHPSTSWSLEVWQRISPVRSRMSHEIQFTCTLLIQLKFIHQQVE